MPTFVLQHFSNPAALRAIDPDVLLRFLRPYEGFFRGRGISLPPEGLGLEPDYDRLTHAFLTPDTDTPHGLIDALYLVDEMSTPTGMDALLDELKARNRSLPFPPWGDPTCADVAIQVWLLDPPVLERKHAELATAKVRSFESFYVASWPTHLDHSEEAVARLEEALAAWFEDNHRGRAAKIFVSEGASGTRFMIRHGEVFKREGSLNGSDPGGVGFRPLRYDLAVYLPGPGELRIHSPSKKEKEQYRDDFGKHQCGDLLAFHSRAKYTLEPLRQGESSLHWADVPGIDLVKLTELHVFFPGDPHDFLIRKSTDVFAVLEAKGGFPEGGTITSATFQVTLSGHRRPRAVAIRGPNVARYTRDEDARVVEPWLALRGFIREDLREDYVPTPALLARR